MQKLISYSGLFYDRVLMNSFKQVVTAGWANKSEGDVESPLGHFALICFTDNEAQELYDAVEIGREYDDGRRQYPLIEPGNYLFCEDSDGNGAAYSFSFEWEATEVFDRRCHEYFEWCVKTEDQS